MKTSTFIGEEELIRKALEALMDRLGVVETNRFLSLIAKKRTESVKRHRLWQSKIDKDLFFDEVFGEP